MRYHISHRITYTYDRSVKLDVHTIRLRPRCDVSQTLHQFALEIDPSPTHLIANVDLDGSSILRAWFGEELTTHLTVHATSEVETCRENAFDYLLEPWAVQFPLDYPISLLDRLQPYLSGQFSRLTGSIDPEAVPLAQEIWQATEGNIVSFLTTLNQRIYQECEYKLREIGDAMPAGITWRTQEGSCRDYTMLFIEVCRVVGLAARFISGYQEGDLDSDDRHLHAWVEVYLPGAGWRGFDPTHGLAVANTHIALVASPTYQQTAPVTGTLKQANGVKSAMDYTLKITKDV